MTGIEAIKNYLISNGFGIHAEGLPMRTGDNTSDDYKYLTVSTPGSTHQIFVHNTNVTIRTIKGEPFYQELDLHDPESLPSILAFVKNLERQI